jgi:hypothetical protein
VMRSHFARFVPQLEVVVTADDELPRVGGRNGNARCTTGVAAPRAAVVENLSEVRHPIMHVMAVGSSSHVPPSWEQHIFDMPTKGW